MALWPLDEGLIGRDRELSELEAGLEEARAGRAYFFQIVGEPGVGKTTLVRSFAERATAMGATVVTGRCWEEGGAPAYWPWVQVVRALIRGENRAVLRHLTPTGSAALAGIVPELSVDPVDAPLLTESEPERARFALFDAVATLLRSRAEADPLVVVLEDIHAADPPSLVLLHFLASVAHDGRVLVIATHRSVGSEPGPAVTQLLAALTRCGRRVTLGGLDPAGVGSYLERVTGHRQTPSVVASIHGATGGNPFFLGQLVRLMTTDRSGHLDTAGGTGMPVPDTVRETVRQRIGLLSPSALRMLIAASVLGQQFTLAAVQRLGDLPLDTALDALGEASDARLLVALQGPPHRYAFAHALVREALLADLRPSERIEWHRRAGETLEELYAADPEPHLAELAFHFAAASTEDATKAIDYASRAGERALHVLAYEEAVQQFQLALGLMDLALDHDAFRYCDLLLSLGDAQWRAGEHAPGPPLAGSDTNEVDPAVETFDRAAVLARKLESPERLAIAALGRAAVSTIFGAVDRETLMLLEEARESLGNDDIALRSQVLARLAMAQEFVAEAEQRRHELVEQAVDVARRVGDSATLARALTAREHICWYDSDKPTRRMTAGEEITALGEDCRDAEMTLQGHMWRVIGNLEAGDLDEYKAALDTYERLARQVGQPLYLFNALSRQAAAALLQGRFRETERLISEAETVAAPARNSEVSMIITHQRTILAAERGEHEEVAARLSFYRDWGAAVPGEWNLPSAIAAWLFLCCGKHDAARQELERVLPVGFDRLRGWAVERIACVSLLAEVAVATASDTPVDVALPLLEPHAERVVTAGGALWAAGSVARYAGLVASALRRYEEAEQYFDTALATERRMGARPWLARTQLNYRQMLLARGRPDDYDRAQQLLIEATATAQELGMKALLAGIAVERVSRGVNRPQPTLLREGDYWTVAYGDKVARLRHMKGLGHLAQLLGHPGREFHVLDLVALDRGDAPSGHHRAEQQDVLVDRQARSAYRQRLQELAEDVEEAEAFHDQERAARARAEIDQLVDQLTGAVGIGGRDRTATSSTERARVSVSKAIKGAIERIRDVNPDLARHLTKTIRTGIFCAYEAEAPVTFHT